MTGTREPRGATEDLAHQIILRHGWNATAYQILNPGIRHWFSPDQEAVAGYADRAGVRVVAGAPVGPAGELMEAALRLEAESAAQELEVCYFCADDRFRRLLNEASPHRAVLIGAQPAWHPARWDEMLATHASLRGQVNRARNKGVTVSERPVAEAAADPGLRRCLQEWLRTRGLPPLHFLVETRTLETPHRRRLFVAERRGEVVGFLVASPIPARGGRLVEQTVRNGRAPNGTMELLIDAAVRGAASAGDRYFTLGLAPLSARVGVPGDGGPGWLRFLLTATRAHVHRFYDFEGLESFKAKFRPAEWEPIFAVAAGPRFTPRMLYAIADVFSDRSVASTLGRALYGAVRQELRGAFGLRPRRTAPA